MNQLKNLRKLKDLSYFDKNTLSQFIELSDSSFYTAINRWVRSGKLIQLKKGWYVTGEYMDKMFEKQAYLEFIANKLRLPSYLSLEYVLQKHGVLSESVFLMTSVTLKSKRVYRNKLGTFVYRSMKKGLFAGYTIRRRGGFEIREATKAKALFDYLYLKFYRVKSPGRELITSLRLNLDEFGSDDKSEFDRYCQWSDIEKYRALPRLLFEL